MRVMSCEMCCQSLPNNTLIDLLCCNGSSVCVGWATIRPEPTLTNSFRFSTLTTLGTL